MATYKKDPDVRHSNHNRTEVTLITNGVKRVFSGKQVIPGEFRVYKIYGDVSKRDELEEAFQELAFKMEVERIAYRPR